MEEIFKNVYIDDRFDIVTEEYRVYGDGKIIALVSYGGHVIYNCEEAKICPHVQKKIANFIEENDLINKNYEYDY